MAFWGIAVKAGQSQKVDVPKDEILHLSQICLHEPKAGKNYLQVQVKGSAYTCVCLEKDKVEHNALDLFFEEACTFINKGSSEMHLSGYMEPRDGDEGSMEEGEESDEEGEESEEEAPAAAGKASAKAKAAASPKATLEAAPQALPKASPKVQPQASPKAAPKATAKAAAKKGEESDDESLLMEEGEEEEREGDESEEEGEESEEEAPKKGAAPAKKRQGAEAAPAAKKAKVEAKAAAKPVAEAKAAAKPAAGAKAAAKPAAGSDPNQDPYVKDLVTFLKANGKTKLGDLGTKVKRSPGVPKMKVVLDQNKDKFAVSGDTVEAK